MLRLLEGEGLLCCWCNMSNLFVDQIAFQLKFQMKTTRQRETKNENKWMINYIMSSTQCKIIYLGVIPFSSQKPRRRGESSAVSWICLKSERCLYGDKNCFTDLEQQKLSHLNDLNLENLRKTGWLTAGLLQRCESKDSPDIEPWTQTCCHWKNVKTGV